MLAGPRNSYSVVQIWARKGPDHYLVLQWRAQADFDDVFAVCRRLKLRFRPCAILIERSAMGPALLSEAKSRGWRGLQTVVVDQRSKADRLAGVADQIRAKRVHIPTDADWVEELIGECIDFPNSRYTDQLDALVQYLEWVEGRPEFPPLSRPAIGAIAFGSRPGGTTPPSNPAPKINPKAPGLIAVARRRRIW